MWPLIRDLGAVFLRETKICFEHMGSSALSIRGQINTVQTGTGVKYSIQGVFLHLLIVQSRFENGRIFYNKK
jgi:hypothetical protein